MDVKERRSSKPLKIRVHREEESMATEDLRRGPWTVEEDFALMNYIARHREGHWNSLARCAGLNRTGKSCRLRWLNYLCPDVRRGNITLEEQLLILELHSRWGNRWSKIAQYLPGRTDNEVKNYWRTRVQNHAKQLNCDVNSKQFKDAMRNLWMPRLVERIRAAKASSPSLSPAISCGTTAVNVTTSHPTDHTNRRNKFQTPNCMVVPNFPQGKNNSTTENSSTAASSNSFYQFEAPVFNEIRMDCYQPSQVGNYPESSITSPSSNMLSYGSVFPDDESWLDEFSDNLWNDENVWFPQQ